uniref:Elongation of very long chain fatty acids protein n=1 Tax=Pectinophora gossypiella TaxID=13191 RepID=A0A1E1WBM7_PECGO
MDVLQNETVEYSIWKSKGYDAFIDEWFLMSSPVPVLSIMSAYLLFVLKLGPDYMKKRPPFNLNNLLVVYNFVQVLVSAFIVYIGLELILPHGILSSVCELDKAKIVPLATGIYYYFSAKVSELLDTVFFVLRKKYNQVTFLHVYHHAIMLMSTWYTLKYEPTYTIVFLGTLNSFVHVVMYSYYALSTFPELSKYLWWKKYITSMQLIQFLAIIVQVSANYFMSGCPPSMFLMNVVLGNTCLMIYLFGDFYVKSYLKNKADKAEKENTHKNSKANGTKTNDVKFTDGISNNNRLHEKTL